MMLAFRHILALTMGSTLAAEVGAQPLPDVATGTAGVTEGESAASASAGPDPNDDTFELEYRRGRQLYDEGRYVEAAAVFESLYGASDPRGRKAAVAYALGQCRRLLGDFPGALAAYRRALVEYSGRADGDADAWRLATTNQLFIVSTNLAVVELVRPRGAAPQVGLCSLRVDGDRPVRYERAELERWIEAQSQRGVSLDHLREVATGLHDGGLFGVKDEAASAEEPCYAGSVRIVLDRTEDHVVDYAWVIRGRAQPARFSLRKADIETGSNSVRLAELAATLELKYSERGHALPLERTRRVSAFLAATEAGTEIPLERGRSQLIAAGSYELFVNAADWKGKEPASLTLMPGEVRTLDVPLEKPRFYEQAWFPWAVVGAAVAVSAVIGAAVLIGDDEPAPPKPVWSVPIE